MKKILHILLSSTILITAHTSVLAAQVSNKNFNEDRATPGYLPSLSGFDFNLKPDNIQSSTQTLTCAAPFDRGNIQQQRTTTVKYDLGNNPQTSIGAWTTTSNTCNRVVSTTNNLGCPSNQRGVNTQTRTYTEYQVGGITNDSGWQTTNTCAFYLVSTGSEQQNLSCGAGYNGVITQSRTFENWSDGSRRNYSGWSTIGNSCVVAAPPTIAGTFINCPVRGPTGMSDCVLLNQKPGTSVFPIQQSGNVATVLSCPSPYLYRSGTGMATLCSRNP